MEVRRKIHNAVFILIALILLSVSCISQSADGDKVAEVLPVEESSKLIDNQKDTLPKLEFISTVRSILEDSKGNFWFGSDKEGVARYDGESFTYFTTKDGLSNNQVRTIQEDQQGNIWFATGYGVCKYDGQKITVQTVNNSLNSNLIFKSKWKKEPADLWFNGEREGDIYRYDGQQLSVLEFPNLDADHESFSISGTVTGICEGENNMLWMANYGGVIGYDGRSFKFINERRFDYHVRSIFADSKGNLWIGNNGIGVLLYDGVSTINFTKKNNVNDENSYRGGVLSPRGTLNHVFTIAEDRHGNIWFGDRDTGAWRYDGKNLVNYTLKDGLASIFVRVIYKDKKGDLWLGMEGGLCKFNGVSFDKMY